MPHLRSGQGGFQCRRLMSLTLDEAFNRMAALCSVSEHCESDVRERLRRAAMSAEGIQSIVDRLYDEQYLDAARYCRAFSRDRLRFSHWGRMKIQHALRQKGLPDADIRQALSELPEDEYRLILTGVLEQKAASLGSGDDAACRAKLVRFALQRGFTMEEVCQISR